MGTRLPILMYHSIGADNATEVPLGWSRFHTVPYSSFCAQLDLLIERGRHAISPAHLNRAERIENPIAITFDDGHLSDVIAAEALKSRGLQAIFFITWANIGRRHYLSANDVRTLDRLGFKIGSHGMTHVNLTGETPVGMRSQLAESKSRLEDLLGEAVNDVAVPYGRYNDQLIETAMALGYRRIMTSDFACANLGNSTVLPRLGITSETSMHDFEQMVTARPFDLARQRIRIGINRRLKNVVSRAANLRSAITNNHLAP